MESRIFYCFLAKGFIEHLICVYLKAIKQREKLGQNVFKFFMELIYYQERIFSTLGELYFPPPSNKNIIRENN